MNGNVSISTKSSGGGGGKSIYLKQREKIGVEQNIHLLVDNKFLEDLKVLSPVEKKERVQLQKNLHIYKKRLESAIEKDKPKVIANNQKKIDEIQAKLDTPIRKGSEKRIIDMTVSLVNVEKLTEDQEEWFDDVVKKFYEKEFGDLHMVTMASHYDQSMPHTHGLMQLREHHESWEQYLLDKYDTSDASEAYSIIQHRWHSHLKSYDLELDDLKKGQRYVPIGQYKAYGNRYRKDIQTESEPLAAHSNEMSYEERIGALSTELLWEFHDAQLADTELTLEAFLEQKAGKSSSKTEKTLKSHSQQSEADTLETRLSVEEEVAESSKTKPSKVRRNQ